MGAASLAGIKEYSEGVEIREQRLLQGQRRMWPPRGIPFQLDDLQPSGFIKGEEP
jgi:hypothetical protein